MTTSKAVRMLIFAVFILSIGTACREKPNKYREVDKFKVDGGLVLRPECEQPGNDCVEKCYASPKAILPRLGKTNLDFHFNVGIRCVVKDTRRKPFLIRCHTQSTNLA